MILLATATRWESGPLAEALSLSPSGAGKAGGMDLTLVETGIGPENARRSLEGLDLPARTPLSAVLSVGLCGALQPGMFPGDLVLEARGAPESWLEPARLRAKDLGLRLHMGTVISLDRVAFDPAQKRMLGESRRAAAVDMETVSIRSWARARGAQFAAARVVLDGVDDRMPDAAPEDGSLRSLAGYLLGRPMDIPLLLRLGLRQRSAMRGLARFLRSWLESVARHETESAA